MDNSSITLNVGPNGEAAQIVMTMTGITLSVGPGGSLASIAMGPSGIAMSATPLTLVSLSARGHRRDRRDRLDGGGGRRQHSGVGRQHRRRGHHAAGDDRRRHLRRPADHMMVEASARLSKLGVGDRQRRGLARANAGPSPKAAEISEMARRNSGARAAQCESDTSAEPPSAKRMPASAQARRFSLAFAAFPVTAAKAIAALAAIAHAASGGAHAGLIGRRQAAAGPARRAREEGGRTALSGLGAGFQRRLPMGLVGRAHPSFRRMERGVFGLRAEQRPHALGGPPDGFTPGQHVRNERRRLRCARRGAQFARIGDCVGVLQRDRSVVAEIAEGLEDALRVAETNPGGS